MFRKIKSSWISKTDKPCFADNVLQDLTDLGTIGEGAYGRVNKMLHNETGRYMAVKVWLLLLAQKISYNSNV